MFFRLLGAPMQTQHRLRAAAILRLGLSCSLPFVKIKNLELGCIGYKRIRRNTSVWEKDIV